MKYLDRMNLDLINTRVPRGKAFKRIRFIDRKTGWAELRRESAVEVDYWMARMAAAGQSNSYDQSRLMQNANSYVSGLGLGQASDQGGIGGLIGVGAIGGGIL